MMRPIVSPSPSQPTLWSYLAEHGRFLAVLSAAAITTGLGLQMALGAYFSRPDFWDMQQLVGLGAEGMMLFTIFLTAISSMGYSGQAIVWSMHALFQLIYEHLRDAVCVPPTHVRLRQRDERQRFLAVKTAAMQIKARLTEKPPSLIASSKSPFLLFQQAPFLVSP